MLSRNNFENYPADWPPKEYFVNPHQITGEQLDKLRQLVNDEAEETEIDQFLRQNLTVMALSLNFFSTGHHGYWIIPQQFVKPTVNHVEQDFKPDYLVGGKTLMALPGGYLSLKGSMRKFLP